MSPSTSTSNATIPFSEIFTNQQYHHIVQSKGHQLGVFLKGRLFTNSFMVSGLTNPGSLPQSIQIYWKNLPSSDKVFLEQSTITLGKLGEHGFQALNLTIAAPQAKIYDAFAVLAKKDKSQLSKGFKDAAQKLAGSLRHIGIQAVITQLNAAHKVSWFQGISEKTNNQINSQARAAFQAAKNLAGVVAQNDQILQNNNPILLAALLAKLNSQTCFDRRVEGRAYAREPYLNTNFPSEVQNECKGKRVFLENIQQTNGLTDILHNCFQDHDLEGFLGSINWCLKDPSRQAAFHNFSHFLYGHNKTILENRQHGLAAESTFNAAKNHLTQNNISFDEHLVKSIAIKMHADIETSRTNMEICGFNQLPENLQKIAQWVIFEPVIMDALKEIGAEVAG